MLSWFGPKKEKQQHHPIKMGWLLQEAVDQALLDWKHAQHRVSMSESKLEIDDAIFYLQLTEKRYMYLMNQARRERLRREA